MTYKNNNEYKTHSSAYDQLLSRTHTPTNKTVVYEQPVTHSSLATMKAVTGFWKDARDIYVLIQSFIC